MSGLDSDGLKKLNSSPEGAQHINKLLRVLTVRTESGKERSGIMLIGGPHDSKVDGAATQRYSTGHPIVPTSSTLYSRGEHSVGAWEGTVKPVCFSALSPAGSVPVCRRNIAFLMYIIAFLVNMFACMYARKKQSAAPS